MRHLWLRLMPVIAVAVATGLSIGCGSREVTVERTDADVVDRQTFEQGRQVMSDMDRLREERIRQMQPSTDAAPPADPSS